MEVVSKGAARVTKGGIYTERDKGMSDPPSHSSERTSAPASTVMASHVPCKCDWLCGGNRRRVHRQLHVTQDFLDDVDIGDRRDDP